MVQAVQHWLHLCKKLLVRRGAHSPELPPQIAPLAGSSRCAANSRDTLALDNSPDNESERPKSPAGRPHKKRARTSSGASAPYAQAVQHWLPAAELMEGHHLTRIHPAKSTGKHNTFLPAQHRSATTQARRSAAFRWTAHSRGQTTRRHPPLQGVSAPGVAARR